MNELCSAACVLQFFFPVRATCVFFSDNVYTFSLGIYLAVYGILNLGVRSFKKQNLF